MNLFNEIEGLAGENLVTAILRLLILRSPEVRERLVKLVSSQSQLGRPLVADSHFSCSAEERTDDEEGRGGRLDLFIEMDDAVIGVENKLLAPFQPGQPLKYLQSVRERARKLSVLRGRDFSELLLVIAPAERKAEVERQITNDRRHFVLLSWDDVLGALEGLQQQSDESTRVTLFHFVEFVRSRSAFLPHLSDWLPHLAAEMQPGGNSVQLQIVGRVWEFFPGSGPRLSKGKTWAGYYFCRDPPTVHTAWYGFVSKADVLNGAQRLSEFVVATTFPVPNLDARAFVPVTLDDGFLGRGRVVHAWAVALDDSWSSPAVWRQYLAPLVAEWDRELERVVRGAPHVRPGGPEVLTN